MLSLKGITKRVCNTRLLVLLTNGLPFLFALTAATILENCSEKPTTAGGSEAGNALVAGTVIDKEGQPAAGSEVKLIASNHNPLTGPAIPDSLVDTTGGDGRFEFSIADTGLYNIEGVNRSSNSRLLLTDIHLNGEDRTLAKTALQKPGAVVVPLPDELDTEAGYVYVPGTTIIKKVDVYAETIILDSVPPGNISEIKYGSQGNESSALFLAKNVSVYPGSTAVAIEDWPKITGFIYNQDGTAAAETKLRVMLRDYSKFDKNSSPPIEDLTDANGKFAYTNMAEGIYSLEAVDEVSGTALFLSDITVGPEDIIVPVLNAVLSPPGAIQVRLADSLLKIGAWIYLPGTSRAIQLDKGAGASSGVIFPNMPAASNLSLLYKAEENARALTLAERITVYSGDTVLINPYYNWQFQKIIRLNTTATGAGIQSTIRDFPLLVRLNKTNFLFNETGDKGQDIRFAKADGTPMAYEIENWDPLKREAAIWVSLDTIYGNTTSQHFILYWGSQGAKNASGGAGVFGPDKGFRGVWHLNQDAPGTGSKGLYLDATGNGSHGTDSISATDKAGNIGLGQAFDGEKDFIEVPPSPVLDLQKAVTLSAWILPQPYQNDNYILEQREGGSVAFSMLIGKGRDVTLGKLGWVSRAADGDWQLSEGEVNIEPGTGWRHVAVVFSSTAKTLSFYVDGKLDVVRDFPWQMDNTSGSLEIGREVFFKNRWFKGSLDEVRIEQAARSADWIKLCFQNQRYHQALHSLPTENLDTWTHSASLLVNTKPSGANIARNLVHYPLLVRLTAKNFNFTEAAENGKDLRFTDTRGAFLTHEVSRWNSSRQQAEVWVRLDTVYGNNDSQFFHMHWGNTNALDRSNSPKVFDEDNKTIGVWHLEDNPADTPPIMQDASINANQGMAYSKTSPPASSSGLIGNALAFSAASQMVYTSKAYNAPGTFSISLWFKADSGSGGKLLGFSSNKFQRSRYFDRHLYMSDNGRLNFGVFPLAQGKIAPEDSGFFNKGQANDTLNFPGIRRIIVTQKGFNDGEWHHACAVLSGEKGMLLYVDGNLEALNIAVKHAQNFKGYWRLGHGQISNWEGRPQNGQFKGLVDEVRVLHRAEQADWVKMNYESQKADARILSIVKEQP